MSQRLSRAFQDPYFTYTTLLLHCDGTDGSTSFPDSSKSAHTLTVSGDAQVDTAIVKFGTGALLLDGTGDFLSAPDSDDWNLGSGAFTIEAYIYVTSTTYIPVYSQTENFGSNVNRIQFGYYSGSWNFYAETGIVVLAPSVTVSAPSTSAWHHVAVTREGNNFRFFLDGVQQGSTQTASGTVPNLSASAYIGTLRASSAQRYLSGSMDDIRITKGVARYAANFTPPPYPGPNR